MGQSVWPGKKIGGSAQTGRGVPPADLRPKACALSVAVDLDDGGVDHGVFDVRIIRDGFEKPLENVGFDPVAETREHAV
jgi:hypothetical protein